MKKTLKILTLASALTFSTLTSCNEKTPEITANSDAFFSLNEEKTGFTLTKCPTHDLETYEVPSTYQGLPVIGIKKTAFNGMKKLKTLIIPDSVSFIDKGILLPVAGTIKEVTTPFIGQYKDDKEGYLGQFFGISNSVGKNKTSLYAEKLTTITITNQESIPEGVLGGSDTITNVTLNKVKEIGVGAFKDMTSLTTISLNEGIETINTGAFSGDTNLTSLNIPDSVKFIDYQAFNGITLKEFKLPKALETFNYSQDMPNLEKWIISSESTNFIVDDGVLYSKNYATLVNFPIKKDPTNFVINNLTTEIGTHAFDHTTITNINFDNISKINSYAFFEAKELNKATFSNKLTFIGSSAFSGCTNLNEVIFSESNIDNELLEVENQVFASCSNLTSITLPKYLVSIGDSMFANDTKLTTVTILGNIKYLGLLSFSKTNITELEITFDDNANIGSRPFLDTKLEKLTIHFVDNITTYPTITSLGLGVNPNIYVDNEEIKTKLKEAWANLLNEVTGLIDVKGTVSPEFTIEDNVLIRYKKLYLVILQRLLCLRV